MASAMDAETNSSIPMQQDEDDLNRLLDLNNTEGLTDLDVGSFGDDVDKRTERGPFDDTAVVDVMATDDDDKHRTKSAAGPVGRLPIPLYLSCNDDFLSPYQCLLRKQIELFEASSPFDLVSNTQGRKRPITLGQVGIRCRHCALQQLGKTSSRGAILYPSRLIGVYQAAQTMANVHLLQQCTSIPNDTRQALLRLKDENQQSPTTTRSSGGKEQWAEMTKILGVYEDECGLRFSKHFGYEL